MQPRPDSGYGTSSVFTLGSEACEALRRGDRQAVDDVMWGQAPSFDHAIEAARGLDAE